MRGVIRKSAEVKRYTPGRTAAWEDAVLTLADLGRQSATRTKTRRRLAAPAV